MTAFPLHLPAPAKINLHLAVTAVRADGYHELDTSFVYVDVADRLIVEPADELVVTCSARHLEGEQNLVYRVLAAMRPLRPDGPGLRVHVEKQLPEQAGLGGGSSDAATAMLAANRLWQLGLTRARLIDIGVRFGADIPAFLYGEASMAGGVGEVLAPLPQLPTAGALLLAHPGVGLSTATVFRAFDRQFELARAAEVALTPPQGGATMRRLSPGGDGWRWPVGHNDLEPIASQLCPELAALLAALRTHSERVWMSGSGTACVALLDAPAEAEILAERLRQERLAVWTHTGQLLAEHPLQRIDIGAWFGGS